MAVFFTPGPAQPYPKLKAFMEEAWAEDVLSTSHRGAQFKDIYRRTDLALRALMDVPADWQIVFMGSATEAMERTLQGLVRRRSHHFVNGAFSKKWYEMAWQLGKSPSVHRAGAGEGFGEVTLESEGDAELVCVTLSETSTGVVWPAAELAWLAAAVAARGEGQPLVAVDVVSAVPVVPVPWAQADAAFFLVQKAFGLPAGLGVLMLGPRAMERAEELAADGEPVGSYHRLTELAKGGRQFQTPETPNVLAIYLLGRVAEDMLARGIGALRDENAVRAATLYGAVNAHRRLEPFVADEAWRSPTVVVAEVEGGSAGLHDHLAARGYVPGRGYGELKDRHIRIANFPASTDEEFEAVLEHLAQYD